MRYRVVRVWEKDPEAVLAGPLATLPLAPLADVSEDRLPDVVQRMEQRIDTEAVAEAVGMLWTTTYLLMGLKYDPELTRQLLKGVRAMKESATYQAILEEGEERGILKGEILTLRKVLLRQGTRRFGAPDALTLAAIEAIESADILEALVDRVSDVENWPDLLNGKHNN